MVFVNNKGLKYGLHISRRVTIQFKSKKAAEMQLSLLL